MNAISNVKVSKSSVMNTAWAMIRKQVVKSLSEALKKAWAALKAKSLMKAHKIKIAYRKADGSIREALATLNLPNNGYIAKGNRKPCYTAIAYYDLEKQNFRSFSVATFMGILEVID